MRETENFDGIYDRDIEIADGIYWIGFYDPQSGLHCNPYLVIDNDEAVMMKILQTGIAAHQIQALIYQHYDPDLCGS